MKKIISLVLVGFISFTACTVKDQPPVETGNGEETPYVKQELSPRIEGVLVIADGGDNAIVIENITEAVQALFGVDTHKIKVMKHN